MAVLLDDKKARRIARDLGLRVIGTLGVLLRAKHAGLVDSCTPVLDELVASGFRVSEALYREAVRLAGESNEEC